MNKKSPISKKERNLFREAVKDVKPIPQDKHKPHHDSSRRLPTTKDDHLTSPPEPYQVEFYPTGDWISGEDCIQFARSGIQHRVLKKLKKGQFTIEATLDLHGLKVNEAATKVTQFILRCSQQKFRWICVIHGKGYSSPEGKPMLKNLINQQLREMTEVLAFHSTQPKDGGTGAVYVLIKSTRGNETHE